ncbi:hypothetical protein [Halococcus sp. PRR34]|uniref:hypothetical protein n=1 Tax=Halococcus sp. PRR34 TaxID=3020830 RepID=UPI00236063C9|nr:hypothetical protein [Halococcus sp. PRR34]
MSRDHQFTVGDVALDTHQESPSPAVVVNLPPKHANEWTAYTDTTVAEDNPEYPDESPIVVVAFYDDLAERAEELLWPESPIPLSELHEYDVKDYAFPVDRLQPAEDTSLAERHAGEDQETTGTNSEGETAGDTDELDDGEPATTREDNEESNATDNGAEPDLHELRDYLRDNGVRSEIDDRTVIVEKLGETYRLSTDEVVEGDGPYRDRLEQLVNDAPV